ncbi:MAG: prolyl oligopeptidase family serine peptidase [Anaerolineales bacterium]|nr:prolyl oligopeptidase family serine peptidase [Anaerolineales bacterium]
MKSRLLKVLFTVILLASCSTEPIETSSAPPTVEPVPTEVPSIFQKPGDYSEAIDVDGTERNFLLHVPPNYQPETPIPLVFNLHGRTDTAVRHQEMTQLNAKADQAGFVVVAPQAIDEPPTWWGAVPTEIGDPDMAFIDALLALIQSELNIDPQRIYATGFSNGASFANRLACSRSEIFAAVAPVSGGHVGYYDCDAEYAVSVLAIHGLNDSIIPYEGNQNNPLVHDWVEAWAERNGCNTVPNTSRPNFSLTLESWSTCNGDNLVALYSIAGAGHSWPGSDFAIEFDGTTEAMNATDEIWDFFASFPKTSLAPIEQPVASDENTESAYPSPGDYFDVLASGSFDRTFKLHVPPSYQTDTPMPLVLVFHGRGSNAFDAENYIQFNPLANQQGFIVAYPQAVGSPSTWEDLPESEALTEVNDIQFVQEFIDYLTSQLSIDSQRIFAVGFSNGGGMVNRLGCDLSEKIAAIAPVAGTYYFYEDCQPNRPIPVISFHGLKDEIIPFEGTTHNEYVNVPYVPDWAAAWAKRNACSPEAESDSKGGVINTEIWTDCAEDADVLLYSLALEAHNWPTTTFGGGGFEPAITVNDLIWEFFDAHPMP